MGLILYLAFVVTLSAQPPDEAIQRLEATVAKSPGNTGALIELLQRYAGQTDNPDAILARRRYILDLIARDPNSPALAAPPSTMDPKIDPQGYAEAARLWRQQAAKPGASPKTAARAAYFFRNSEPSTAFALLESALNPHPGDPDLRRMRGALDAARVLGNDPKGREEIEGSQDSQLLAGASEYMLREPLRPGAPENNRFELAELWAKRSADVNLLIGVYQRESAMALDPREKARFLSLALQAATTDQQRVRVLPDLANFEFESGNDDAAARDAHQLLDLARNQDDPLHAAHTVLGRVALDRGDKAQAIEELLQSVRIKKSNGPKMTLAQDLLDAGERDAVVQYLELCRGIWTNDPARIEHYFKVVSGPGKGDLLAPFTPPGRTAPARTVLPAPAPHPDSVAWESVLGAESYVVEWDARDEKGWLTDRDHGLVRVIPTRETAVTLEYRGDRPIRWRVYAVSTRSGAGKSSDWREIQNPLRVLPDHAEAELMAGDLEGAERDARQLLRMTGSSDLTHSANTLLGRIALRRGNLNEAKERLADSARIEASPMLGSFGPSMKLAQELLAAGERDAVLEYLEECRLFWKSDRGRLDRLVDLVQHAAAPNLLLPYSDQGPSLTGAKAPSFRLKDLGGKEWTLEQLAGKVTVLDFWTTWCLPCLEQLPILDSLAKERGVTVLAVDVGEDEATVRGFLDKNHVGVPVLLAGEDAMILNYRVAVYPTLAVIDRTGHIREYHIGNATKADLAEVVAQ